jgi:hypothetical protein
MARRGSNTLEPDALMDEILLDAYEEEEEMRAFHEAFQEHVRLPADGYVIGEPVSINGIGFDGNTRRGLTASCRKQDGSVHELSLADVGFPEGSRGAVYLAAYRKWMGLEPAPLRARAKREHPRRHRATQEDIVPDKPVELIVLSVKERAARCRIPGTERELTLRSKGIYEAVPGEIILVRPKKQWRFSGHPYLSGEVISRRIDVPRLGLSPLNLVEQGIWDPAGESRPEEEPIPEWLHTIMKGGRRPAYEMEQIIPGEGPDDPFDNPIVRAGHLEDAGDLQGARRLLMEVLQVDLRCLDAHGHLGHLLFDGRPRDAIRHYEMGMRIGALSLRENFDGVLLWGLIGNRPFLRCLHGYALCLWRIRQFEKAGQALERLLRLNPPDTLGIRSILAEVCARMSWEASRLQED